MTLKVTAPADSIKGINLASKTEKLEKIVGDFSSLIKSHAIVNVNNITGKSGEGEIGIPIQTEKPIPKKSAITINQSSK